MATSKLQALWNHPAGPKTKYNIIFLPIAVINYAAVTATGVIWSRYSTVITPKNWNLFSVNVAMAGTGIYQLTRKIRYA
nr:mitochondrial pyruvate carrier 4 [Ipomoea batatas]